MDGGARGWPDLPDSVRKELASAGIAGGDSFFPAAGGYTDGIIGLLDDEIFVKAVPEDDPAARDYLTEARVSAALGSGIPTPSLRLATQNDGWVALAFEIARGDHAAEPWEGRQLRLVLDAVDQIEDALTPSPVDQLPTVAERMRGRCSTWGRLRDDGTHGALTRASLSSWEGAHLDQLADLESRAETLFEGDTLLHFDLRHDNIFIDGDSVTFVDWGRACTGPGWVDVVCMLLESEVAESHLDTLFLSTRRGTSADPEGVDAFLTILASYWRYSATLPTPGSPGLQERRARSRDATLRWLSQRWD
ncbi:phosphotransferase family protein [Herbiconiux sp. A18JL235]|uniref:Phosphotransferase family protein n=1 Tax=Herbiconiux sp. A18JL235 TaxID=3152363 RepID=A0AB39BG61_9MICO